MLSFLDANDNWPSLDVTQMRAACILSNYLGELIVNAASLEQSNHNKGSEHSSEASGLSLIKYQKNTDFFSQDCFSISFFPD